MRLLLGIDCGLTLVKAVLFDETGQKRFEARRETPLDGDRIDANQVFIRVVDCVRDVLRGARANAGDILCVGVSGHGNGLYALSVDGEAIAAFSSMTARPQPYTDAFKQSDGYAAFQRRTHQTAWAGQPMQILRWLKAENPPLYRRISAVLLCKDWINYCLTGVLSTDYSDASAAALLGGGDAGLYALLGIPEKEGALPSPRRSAEIIGTVTKGAASATGLQEGTPVCGGFFDAAACMLGSGAANVDRYAIVAGTWGISAAYLDALVTGPSLTQACHFADADTYMAIVSAPTSCVNLDWFVRSVRPGLTYAEANAIAEAYSPADIDLLYLPFLHPDMRHPRVKAGFFGLKPHHTWRDMLRAVYEGVAFAHRLQIDRLNAAGILRPAARLTGGAANAPLWCDLFAQCIGVPVETAREKQAGALGAAIAASVAAGVYPTLEKAAEQMVAAEALYPPRCVGAYDDKYGEFLRLIEVSQ